MRCAKRWLRGGLFAVAAAVCGGVTAGVAGGCYTEGGPLWSADRYTYVSRPWSPKTVSVVDTRTEETIWSVDIPVGQQLVISFQDGRGPNPNNPDLMTWEVMEAGRIAGPIENAQAAPPRSVRRIEMELRPAPEYADFEVSPVGG